MLAHTALHNISRVLHLIFIILQTEHTLIFYAVLVEP